MAPQKTHFLVYDEITKVPNLKRGGEYPFRVRVWMGKGQEPVALVSKPRDSDVPPSWMCSRVANRVYRDFLRKPKEFRYFEVQYIGTPAGHRRHRDEFASLAGAGEGDPLAEILFERTGPIDGPILVKPITRPRTWEALESLVGEPITDRD
jgi:hypothetical protein